MTTKPDIFNKLAKSRLKQWFFMEEPGRITQLIDDWKSGNSNAQSELFELLYGELHAMAHRQRRGARDPSETLNTTALIHEAYLKFDRAGEIVVNDRSHFLLIASRVMRQILIDHARKMMSQKRGGGARRVTFGPESDRDVLVEAQAEELLDIDRVLSRLEAQDERLGRIVELRFFGGLTHDEIADSLDIGRTTVTRDWAFAKAWLHAELEDLNEKGSGDQEADDAD